ncbi:MAG: cell division ATP-binding protein FtsE [Eubacteriales bacterium]|jgi:cell division transport system ATP-binding protein
MVIEFRDVEKVYDNGTKALQKVSFSVEQGEFVFIIGHSGAGKSTLLKLMTCEEEVTEGEIIINGYNLRHIKKREIPYMRRTIGMVFQDFRLIESKTVFENVAFAMRAVGASTRAIKKRVPYVLSMVGLAHKTKSYPNQLSGGEQQRVALARALVNNPALIIADEPTGNIDPRMSFEIMQLLQEINNRGTTIVLVTHERDLVDMMKKRVITIESGEVVSDRTGGYDDVG